MRRQRLSLQREISILSRVSCIRCRGSHSFRGFAQFSKIQPFSGVDAELADMIVPDTCSPSASSGSPYCVSPQLLVHYKVFRDSTFQLLVNGWRAVCEARKLEAAGKLSRGWKREISKTAGTLSTALFSPSTDTGRGTSK